MAEILKWAEGRSIPPDIHTLCLELQVIRENLDKYTQTEDSKFLKEAVAKIKSNAPKIKALGSNTELLADEFMKELSKKCKAEMKYLFERAKAVGHVENFTHPGSSKRILKRGKVHPKNNGQKE